MENANSQHVVNQGEEKTSGLFAEFVIGMSSNGKIFDCYSKDQGPSPCVPVQLTFHVNA